jgi:hypothetical protein
MMHRSSCIYVLRKKKNVMNNKNDKNDKNDKHVMNVMNVMDHKNEHE